MPVQIPAWAAGATVREPGETDLVIGNLATGDAGASDHLELAARIGAGGLLEDMARAAGS